MHIFSKIVAIGLWTVDERNAVEPQRTMQDALVRIVVSQYMVEEFSGGNSSLEVCQWPGIECDAYVLNVTCSERIVQKLVLANDFTRNHRIQFHFAPPTLEYFEIYGFTVIGEFSPRRLPRSSLFICIARTNLKGTIDFKELPRRIEELNLYGNHLHGPLILSNLPSNLLKINLLSNDITQKELFYSDIPDSLKSVCIDRTAGMETPLNTDKIAKDRNLFIRI